MNTAAGPSPVKLAVRSVPHSVDGVRNDAAVVAAGAGRGADTAGRQQVALAHQAKHPAQRGPYADVAQPRPDLAMALTMERAGGEHGVDRCGEGVTRRR